MNYRILPLAVLIAASLFAGCGEHGEALVEPHQPTAVDSSKADGMSRDIVTTDTNEALRSTSLRRQLCDVIAQGEDIFEVFHQRNAFDRDCAGQHTFTVTAFHSSTELQDTDGVAALVAMDVLVETSSPAGFAFATRLIRAHDDEALTLGWRPALLDILSRPTDVTPPGIVGLPELVGEVSTRIGYVSETDLAPFFEDAMETAEEPEAVLDDLDQRVDAAEDANPGLNVASGDWLRVVNSDGEHIGYMCPTTDFYPNEPYGDEVFTGTLYFYDLDENFFDAVTWSY